MAVPPLPMALGSDLLWVHPKDNTDSQDPFTIWMKLKKKPKVLHSAWIHTNYLKPLIWKCHSADLIKIFRNPYHIFKKNNHRTFTFFVSSYFPTISLSLLTFFCFLHLVMLRDYFSSFISNTMKEKKNNAQIIFKHESSSILYAFTLWFWSPWIPELYLSIL